jgi:Zn-dependent protease with chaperone function
MYTNFIYFIVVLFIYSTHQPSPAPRLSFSLTLVASLGLFCVFFFINGWVFRRLAARMSKVTVSSHLAVLYHRTIARQSFLSLLFFCLNIYLLDLKFFLSGLPVMRVSFTLQGLAALALFLLHQTIVWLSSHECHCHISGTSCSRSSMVAANLKFNLAILLPWLLISGTFDFLQFLPIRALHDHLNTALGQVVFFAFLLVIFMLYAPPLVVRLWGCRPLPPGALRSSIEAFCRKEGFKLREILLLPSLGGSFLTAGVMGLQPHCRYLLLTQGLLNILDENELQAVLAHEMGHVKEKHLVFYLLFLLGYLVVAYPLSNLSFLLVLASDLPLHFPGGTQSELLTLISILATLPLLLLLVLYFRFLFGFFIRNFERQADLYIFRTQGGPYSLVSALEKVAFYSGNTRDVPSWHHFSIKQRVDYLTAAASNPSLLLHHRRKLRTALASYLVGLVAVGTVGFLYHTSAWGKSFNEDLSIKVLHSLVRLEPERADLRLKLGTLHYTRDNLEEAVFQLSVALDLEPNNPEIMNNLAWIFATSQRPTFFRPEHALDLAEKAASRSPEPYILDTLAEAYYVNNRPALALAAAEQALAAASGDRTYYLGQVKRFRELVGEHGSKFF